MDNNVQVLSFAFEFIDTGRMGNRADDQRNIKNIRHEELTDCTQIVWNVAQILMRSEKSGKQFTAIKMSNDKMIKRNRTKR